MKRSLFSAAALCCVSAAPAFAGDLSPYVGVFYGADWRDDQRLDGSNAAAQLRDIDADFDGGKFFGLNVGIAGKDRPYGRLRAEAEASFRSSDVSALSLNGVPRTVLDGSEVSVASGMINVFYDTPKLFDFVRLSAGAGFGIASVDHEIRYLVANAAAIGSIPGNLQIAIPSTETTYAYQFIGGFEIPLSEKLSLTSNVRYFRLGDTQAERYVLNSIVNGTPTTLGTLDSVLESKTSGVSFVGGLRFSF